MRLLVTLLLASSARAQSSGCGSSAWAANSEETISFEYDGTSYSHIVQTPSSYDPSVPAPLLLYFHGWGGSSTSCYNTCDDANDAGFVTASLTGVGPTWGASWNAVGSAASPGPAGPTCSSGATDYCYDDCDGACADNCWWTTCKDSVRQAMDLLDYLETELCIDTARIWASGCSNGGLFTFELARDARSAPRLAGIAPQVRRRAHCPPGSARIAHARSPPGEHALARAAGSSPRVAGSSPRARRCARPRAPSPRARRRACAVDVVCRSRTRGRTLAL